MEIELGVINPLHIGAPGTVPPVLVGLGAVTADIRGDLVTFGVQDIQVFTEWE